MRILKIWSLCLMVAVTAAMSFAPARAASLHDRYDAARQATFDREHASAILAKDADRKAPDASQLNFGLCDNADDMCLEDKARITIDFAFAYKGLYQAQRNMAYCMLSTCNGVLFENKNLGCAWRIVIAASGDPEVDDSDASNLDFCLNKLSDSERLVAKAQAGRLFKLIYKRTIASP
jgi:hypothetical protein